jgi:hypothetical protein
MGGFSDPTINEEFKQSLFDIIVEKLICCCELMKESHFAFSQKIYNDELKIMNCLVAEFLDNDDIRNKIGLDALSIGFIPESLEKYDELTNTYIGRVDIKIVPDDWLKYTKNYFIAECKRIDGSSNLNKKYITDGVARFVRPPIKYSSYHNKNIMLGFVVKNIDIKMNTTEIDTLQTTILSDLVHSNLLLLQQKNNEYHLYSGAYNVDNDLLELQHIFYTFSDIVKEKPVMPKKSRKCKKT